MKFRVNISVEEWGKSMSICKTREVPSFSNIKEVLYNSVKLYKNNKWAMYERKDI